MNKNLRIARKLLYIAKRLVGGDFDTTVTAGDFDTTIVADDFDTEMEDERPDDMSVEEMVSKCLKKLERPTIKVENDALVVLKLSKIFDKDSEKAMMIAIMNAFDKQSKKPVFKMQMTYVDHNQKVNYEDVSKFTLNGDFAEDIIMTMMNTTKEEGWETDSMVYTEEELKEYAQEAYDKVVKKLMSLKDKIIGKINEQYKN